VDCEVVYIPGILLLTFGDLDVAEAKTDFVSITMAGFMSFTAPEFGKLYELRGAKLIAAPNGRWFIHKKQSDVRTDAVVIRRSLLSCCPR